MRDIELDDPRITVAVLRELAVVRTDVPSNRDFPVQKMDKLRDRVRAMAQAIVDGGTMERRRGSRSASQRNTT
jgi:hypothetical protein